MAAYDGVSAGGMIDTIFGNWKPNQNKSALSAVSDGVEKVGGYLKQPPQAKDKRVQNLINNPGLAVAGPLVGNYLANTKAESDYAASHGGQYPASPEELRAYQSYNSRGGVLSTPPNQQPEVENGLNVSPQSGESVSDILGLGDTNPAQDQAQGELNKSRAQAQDSKSQLTKEISQGYTPPPDSKVDPAGYIAAINANKAKGVGGSTGTFNVKAPDPLSQSQQQMIELNQQGKSAAFDMTNQPPWYQSNSFNYGLISFGLNLLSGNDLATSFAAAGGAFTDMYGQEQRGHWAKDLQNQGYSPQEIEEYIRTGNSKALTDPEEKKAKQIQMQTNLQQLNNLQYEGSPEMRQYKLNREERKDALSEMQIRNTMANQNAQTGLASQRLALEREKQIARSTGPDDMHYTDTDGRKWTVMRNARGTPLVNANGMATLYDPLTGESTWRNLSDNQRQMGAIQANEGLHALDQFENGGLISYTGNSLVAKGSRWTMDQAGQNVSSDLNSQLENLNGSIRATLETQLMQENNNRPVQKYMLDTAVKRLGKLDINSSPEENSRVLANYRSVLNSQYNARDETHPSINNRDYANPTRPGVTFDGSKADSGSGLYVGQVVNGMTYIGGNPNSKSSWK